MSTILSMEDLPSLDLPGKRDQRKRKPRLSDEVREQTRPHRSVCKAADDRPHERLLALESPEHVQACAHGERDREIPMIDDRRSET